TFIDTSSSGCNPKINGTAPFGFYVAAWSAPWPADVPPPTVDSDPPRNFGLFEAHPRDASLSFSAFVSSVLSRNTATFKANTANTSVMNSARMLVFNVPYRLISADRWQFSATGDPALDALGKNMAGFPLAIGDTMSTLGHAGTDTFKNPATGDQIVMNYG